MNEIVTHASREPLRRVLGILGLLLVYAGLTVALYRALTAPRGGAAPAVHVVTGASPPQRHIELAAGQFWVAGEPFFINAVGWDPARPGEVPWKRRFVREEVDADFRRIRAAGFNTIRTWAPLRDEELQLAAQNDLRVLQGIWTPPDGDFRDPGMRRRVLDTVARAVETSRWSPAVIGYLVLNEPSAKAVAQAGLDESVAWLREIVATVRALDPGAPIGYASWPGMEALDDGLLDFAAFNLYPHRPRAAMDDLGIAPYTRLLRDSVARGRPFLVSEFGISVSPGTRDGRGGATEEQQAQQLVALASTFASCGVAGTVVFQWNDGWWKNHDAPGDELTHDADDPEEWFGLIRFSGLSDRLGTPRPALSALTRYNRAVLMEPRDGEASSANIPVRVFGAGETEVIAHAGKAMIPVSMHREGRWRTGTLALPAPVPTVMFELREGGEHVRGERRRTTAAGAAAVTLGPARQTVAPGAPFPVIVHGPPRAVLQLAAYTEHHFDEQPRTVALDDRGRGRAVFRAPPEQTILTVLAFEKASGKAAWAAVEVR